MKKSKLIAILQEIEGDPEVKLWNGYVGDWMDIGEVLETYLVKQTKEYYKEMCRLERCRDLQDWNVELSEDVHKLLDSCYTRIQWEHDSYVTQEDLDNKRYRKKKVLVLQAKTRGINTHDRIGGISY